VRSVQFCVRYVVGGRNALSLLQMPSQDKSHTFTHTNWCKVFVLLLTVAFNVDVLFCIL